VYRPPQFQPGECLSPAKGPTKTWGGAAPLAKPSMPFAGGSRQVVFGEINWKHTLRNKKKKIESRNVPALDGKESEHMYTYLLCK